MKRNFIFAGLLAGSVWLSASALAQDSPAADAAAREETESNAKRINIKVEQLEETLQTQQKRIAALVGEVHALREELDRLKSRNENAATQESIKRLADKIEEVDKKRQADNELVIAQFKALGKGLSKSVQPKEPAAPTANKIEAAKVDPPPQNNNAPPEKGYTYKIKDGDTLVRIVTELRNQGFKVTQKQVMDANPKVNWNRLKIGQSVFIPEPMP